MDRIRKLRSGDWVEVKNPDEILATLDANGTLEGLPFMREMVEYCGKRFRVSQRVVKVCASGMKTGSTLRAFCSDDVVLLDGLRCSGVEHDGCQKACTIFWREAWLRKVEGNSAILQPKPDQSEQLRARLQSKAGPNIYFCQASELLRVSREMPKIERYSKCLTELSSGNCGVFEMARRIGIFLFWKARRAILGPYARGKRRLTPSETLNLQAGELVQVKPMESIAKTLDDKASNRGLWFSPNMRLLCGQQQRIEKKITRLIVDGSGEMRQLKNTVFLEGSFCSCPHIAFGGCSRREYVYWREIWLSRTNSQTLKESPGSTTSPCMDECMEAPGKE